MGRIEGVAARRGTQPPDRTSGFFRHVGMQLLTSRPKSFPLSVELRVSELSADDLPDVRRMRPIEVSYLSDDLEDLLLVDDLILRMCRDLLQRRVSESGTLIAIFDVHVISNSTIVKRTR